jgi:hypothetical protein
VTPNEVALVELCFDGFSVLISVENADDTLVCARRLESLPEPHRVAYPHPLSTDFWDHPIGQTLVSAWQMTDDGGYPDAIQLRFRQKPNEGDYATINLEAVASAIVLSEFNVVRQMPQRVW